MYIVYLKPQALMGMGNPKMIGNIRINYGGSPSRYDSQPQAAFDDDFKFTTLPIGLKKELIDYISVHDYMYTESIRKDGKYHYLSCMAYAEMNETGNARYKEGKGYCLALEMSAQDISHIQEFWDLLLGGNIAPEISTAAEQIAQLTTNIKTMGRWLFQSIRLKMKKLFYSVKKEIETIN